jgi:hypothetical protein
MKKIIILVLITLSSLTHANCNDGYKRCVNECNVVKSIFNYDDSQYIKSSDTDFQGKCEDSCRRGKRYCEYESNLSDGCYEFKRKCRNECPSSLFSYKSSQYLFNTDANGKCEDSCSSGYRRCE